MCWNRRGIADEDKTLEVYFNETTQLVQKTAVI